MTRPRLLFAVALAALVALGTAGLAQTSGPAAPRPARASAETPRDLYHRGARLFVDGETDAALTAVDAGLARAPDDARLKALRDLIQQQQDEQDQQDNEQDSQDQDGGENPDDQDSDEDPGESDPNDGQESGADAPPRDPSQGEGQPPAPPASAGAQPGKPGEMTPAQADRILDAVGGQERLLLREIRRSPTGPRRSDKDW